MKHGGSDSQKNCFHCVHFAASGRRCKMIAAAATSWSHNYRALQRFFNLKQRIQEVETMATPRRGVWKVKRVTKQLVFFASAGVFLLKNGVQFAANYCDAPFNTHHTPGGVPNICCGQVSVPPCCSSSLLKTLSLFANCTICKKCRFKER